MKALEYQILKWDAVLIGVSTKLTKAELDSLESHVPHFKFRESSYLSFYKGIINI